MTTTDFDARRYWDRRLRRDWTLHGVGMARLAHSYNRWMYRVRGRVFRRTVRKTGLDVAGSTVLDVGSGTGFYIDWWRRLGARRLSGVDIADSAVARLRERFPEVRFERVDVSDEVPFDDGAFDVVSAFDVLFHIVDDERYPRAVAGIHRMLRPGGWFIFSEHFVHDQRRGRRHHVSRTLGEIEELLHRTGFDIVSRRPMFVFMAWPVDSGKRWRWDLWSKRMLPLIKQERWGGVVGAALYPAEVLLTRVLRESPSMEIMVCRKRDGAS